MGKAKKREEDRARYKAARLRATNILGGKCVVCGSTKNLEIDHIDPSTKEFEVSSVMYLVDTTKLDAELKKCQLLCKRCHIAKSLKERGQVSARTIHGTLASYRYCKCPICTKAHTEYCTEYNRKRKLARKKRAYRRKKNVTDKD